jgi:lipid-binding SYLF domain-containing protein
MKKTTLFAAVLLVAVAAILPAPAFAAEDAAEARQLVIDSGTALDHFVADPDMGWFRDHAKEAKGLFICSKIVKAGFILGGSGGRCVFVAKGDHGWAGPAFYTMGTASIGFQAGVDVAEIIMLAMNQKAVDSLMSGEFKAGAGASVAAGPVGAGTGAATSDFIVYSRNKGVYGGVDVNGSVIKPTEDFNKAYYGKPVSAIDIIAKGSVHNPQANDPLMSRVEKLYGSGKK